MKYPPVFWAKIGNVSPVGHVPYIRDIHPKKHGFFVLSPEGWANCHRPVLLPCICNPITPRPSLHIIIKVMKLSHSNTALCDRLMGYDVVWGSEYERWISYNGKACLRLELNRRHIVFTAAPLTAWVKCMYILLLDVSSHLSMSANTTWSYRHCQWRQIYASVVCRVIYARTEFSAFQLDCSCNGLVNWDKRTSVTASSCPKLLPKKITGREVLWDW